MHLSIPQRSVADTGSFPVDPDGARVWIDTLRPLDSSSDASEIYRGLKHSNRLHNDVDQRRAVLSCFIPVLRELHEQLDELNRAQPLPLTREFARNARLSDALLREEAFAFKILLSDSESPLEDDARRAMQALARQATAAIHAYRRVPTALLLDAHQIFALAEQHKLIESPSNDYRPLLTHYKSVLLLSLIDAHQLRVRQLPLMLDWLLDAAETMQILPLHTEEPAPASSSLAIHLGSGTGPSPLASLRINDELDIRLVDIQSVLTQMNQRVRRTKPTRASLLVADTLEHQTLVRLQQSLVKSGKRRSARTVINRTTDAVFGHKEITAHLLFEPVDTDNKQPNDDSPGNWTVINESALGACLSSDSCRAGLVQPGELITLCDRGEPDEQDTDKTTAPIGVIRWVRASHDETLLMGVEYLARSVLPVTVKRSDSKNRLAEPALIIACKVQKQVLQTMLLPAFLYQTGDHLTAMQGKRSRRVLLRRCLQTNGLYSHFSLRDD
ncbi:MAG: hypothetical protein V3U76_01700 [Granulosicoccus sp.]